MNKLISGKVSVLVLTAAFFVASFLLGKSATSVLATDRVDECNETFDYVHSSDYDDNRVHFEYEEDESWKDDFKHSISLTAGAGYEIVEIWLEVDGIREEGWDLHFTSALNDYNPNPGDKIDNARAVVRKVCAPPVVDLCDNLDGDQEVLPEGIQEDEGFCSCKKGYHEVNSEGLTVATDGLNDFTCVADDPIPTPYDACFNLEGTQSGVPDGYHKDSEDGACNQYQLGGAPPPSDSAGVGGQVLGASTMAGTGSFAETLYLAVMGLGGLITATGLKIFKKA